MNNYVTGYTIQGPTTKNSDILLIIPVINEGSRIKKQILEISGLNFATDIVIADGGSTDGSLDDVAFFVCHGVSAILTKQGPGKLSAQLQMAFSYAIKHSYKFVITMDGNGKDGPEGIEMIAKALYAGFDFVQGSRFIRGGSAVHTPMSRYFAIRLIHAPLTSLAAGRRFSDTTNGFRGFSKRLIESDEIGIFRKIFDTYELIFYLPIRAARLGLKTCEVPVRREYPRFGATPTKIVGLKALTNLIWILLLACFGCFNPK